MNPNTLVIPTIWPISLTPEAFLAGICWRKEGFFGAFLAFDVAANLAGMAAVGTGYYPVVNATAELIGMSMLALAVREAYSSLDLKGWEGSLISCAAAIAIPSHILLARNVEWSEATSLLWNTIALSHILMGVFLVLSLFSSQRFSPHSLLMAVWIVGSGGFFYAATAYLVGYPMLWFNFATWSTWIFVSLAVIPTVRRLRRL